jgi:hypothetical protein
MLRSSPACDVLERYIDLGRLAIYLHMLGHAGNDSNLEASPRQALRVSKHLKPKQFESRNIDAIDIPKLEALVKLISRTSNHRFG